MPKKVDAKRPKPQEAENVNLYGQIPYYVLSKMPNITSFYALIQGKSRNEKGYCYAGTQYFADFFGVPILTIKRWRKTLIEQGFIEIVKGYNRAKNETLGIKVVNKITSSKDDTSNKDDTSIKDVTTTSIKDVTSTSIKDDTLVSTVSKYSKDNNICANDICTNDSLKNLEGQKEDALQDLFNDFWGTYPRKQNKKQALARFKAVMKLKGKAEREAFGDYAGKTPAEKVAMMIQAFSNQFEGKEVEYIPHASTWLNGYRWSDELKPASAVVHQNKQGGYSEAYADEFGV